MSRVEAEELRRERLLDAGHDLVLGTQAISRKRIGAGALSKDRHRRSHDSCRQQHGARDAVPMVRVHLVSPPHRSRWPAASAMEVYASGRREDHPWKIS